MYIPAQEEKRIHLLDLLKHTIMLYISITHPLSAEIGKQPCGRTCQLDVTLVSDTQDESCKWREWVVTFFRTKGGNCISSPCYNQGKILSHAHTRKTSSTKRMWHVLKWFDLFHGPYGCHRKNIRNIAILRRALKYTISKLKFRSVCDALQCFIYSNSCACVFSRQKNIRIWHSVLLRADMLKTKGLFILFYCQSTKVRPNVSPSAIAVSINILSIKNTFFPQNVNVPDPPSNYCQMFLLYITNCQLYYLYTCVFWVRERVGRGGGREQERKKMFWRTFYDPRTCSLEQWSAIARLCDFIHKYVFSVYN